MAGQGQSRSPGRALSTVRCPGTIASSHLRIWRVPEPSAGYRADDRVPAREAAGGVRPEMAGEGASPADELKDNRGGGLRPDRDGLADRLLRVAREPGSAVHDGRLGCPVDVQQELKVDVPDIIAV